VDQPRGDHRDTAIPSRCWCSAGGVVGVEMAQAYAWLGARVTVVEALPHLIAGEEEFASELVREAGLEERRRGGGC
jgi:dihydrolipoamide dehydrogenase